MVVNLVSGKPCRAQVPKETPRLTRYMLYGLLTTLQLQGLQNGALTLGPNSYVLQASEDPTEEVFIDESDNEKHARPKRMVSHGDGTYGVESDDEGSGSDWEDEDYDDNHAEYTKGEGDDSD